jgi:hypothetical protein
MNRIQAGKGTHMSNRRRRIILGAGLASLLGGWPLATLSQQPPPGGLLAPWQQYSSQAAFSVSLRNQGVTFPIAGGGYLLSTARVFAPGNAASIVLTLLATGQQISLPFALNSASAIRIEAGAISDSGTVLLAGSYSGSPNGVELLKAFAHAPGVSGIKNFVAEVATTGRVLQTTDLGDYTPERICGSPDGTLWTLGQRWPEEAHKGQPQNYMLIRHYGPSGTLINSYLSRSSVTKGITPSYHAKEPSARQAFLACGDSTVAAYVGTAPVGALWVEIDPATQAVQILRARNPEGAILTGLVLLSPHTAYASFGTPSPSEKLSASGQRSGLFQLVPASTSASWHLVPRANSSTVFSILLGRQGSSLVHLLGPKSPTADPRVYLSAF